MLPPDLVPLTTAKTKQKARRQVRDQGVLRTKVSIKATAAPSGVEVCGDFDSQNARCHLATQKLSVALPSGPQA